MKRAIWMAILCLGCLAVHGADELDALDIKLEEWDLSVELIRDNYNHQRDALQQRRDYDYSNDKEWESGDTSGGGYGVRVTASKDKTGTAALKLAQSGGEYEYDFVPQPGDGLTPATHAIDTDRFEFDLCWYQIDREYEEKHARRGWLGGIRYLDTEKKVEINEAPATVLFKDSISWKLLHAGYFGEWRPFGWRTKVTGLIGFLFGEVDGIAREGNDVQWGDGQIEESWSKERSWCYGMDIQATLTVDVHKHAALGVGYRREWLYSFDATDTGMAMYPDNDDALFIENSAFMTAHFVAIF